MSEPTTARRAIQRPGTTSTAARHHLRLVRPPETEPPHTSSPPHAAAVLSGPRTGARPASEDVPVQGTLALLFTLPGGAPAEPTPAPARRATGVARHPWADPDLDDERPPPEPTSTADLPDPRRWSARLVQAAIEARHGARPVAQLLRWTTREVYERTSRECVPLPSARPATGPRTVRPVIRSLHVSEPADGVVEACATIHDGTRGRAVVVRLEGLDGRWLCTVLDVL